MNTFYRQPIELQVPAPFFCTSSTAYGNIGYSDPNSKNDILRLFIRAKSQSSGNTLGCHKILDYMGEK